MKSTLDLIWFNGCVVPWTQAQVHVTSETAMRGTNAFEGVRAYWQVDTRSYSVVALHEHLDRLRRSAQILGLPADHLVDELSVGIADLIRTLDQKVHLYLRPTIYLAHGNYADPPEEWQLGAFISAKPVPHREERPLRCAISHWQRGSDRALPSTAKIGATYTAFRLARLDAASKGADEAILLNTRGHVAETCGAAVFVVRHGRVSTPPIADGILEGITRRIAIDLLSAHFSIQVSEESISSGQLYTADEVFLCGTLDEIRAVGSIDGRVLPGAPGPITRDLRSLYLSICEGKHSRIGIGWIHDVCFNSDTLSDPGGNG